MNNRLRIRGGLALSRLKPGLDRPLLDVPPPARLVLPLLGHDGRTRAPRVAIGERLSAGDEIAAGLVAPVSGTVEAIESHPVLHADRDRAPCVLLSRLDGAEPPAHRQVDAAATPHDRLQRGGVHGLGGAGFASAIKLQAIARHGRCRLLLVNACECEPGIACDEALLQHDAPGIVGAIIALATALRAERVAIAIEADKSQALATLRDALRVGGLADRRAERRADVPLAPVIDLLAFEPLYPSGAEPPLLDAALAHLSLSPLERDRRPAEQGVLCLNIATVAALSEVLDGRVPATRIVTLCGDAGPTSFNARVTFGTPLRTVLDAAGWTRPARVRIGGPLSGYPSAALDAPITATVHAVAPWPLQRAPNAPHAAASVLLPPSPPTPRPCIRCGDCEPVCPVALQPQQLHWHAVSGQAAALDRLGIGRCIECGCCDVVCPSGLPLTQTFRAARQRHRLAIDEAHDAEEADRLVARREARLARDAGRDFAAATPPQDRIAAALARARARTQQ